MKRIFYFQRRNGAGKTSEITVPPPSADPAGRLEQRQREDVEICAVLKAGSFLLRLLPRAFGDPSSRGVAVEGEVWVLPSLAFSLAVDDKRVIDFSALVRGRAPRARERGAPGAWREFYRAETFPHASKADAGWHPLFPVQPCNPRAERAPARRTSSGDASRTLPHFRCSLSASAFRSPRGRAFGCGLRFTIAQVAPWRSGTAARACPAVAALAASARNP